MSTIEKATRVYARNLLAEFGNCTTVYIDILGTVIEVRRSRDHHVIAQVELGNVDFNGQYWGSTTVSLDGVEQQNLSSELLALEIRSRKSFPRSRNFKRSWSPVVYNASTKHILDTDPGARFL
jgi:hypothetical protein